MKQYREIVDDFYEEQLKGLCVTLWDNIIAWPVVKESKLTDEAGKPLLPPLPPIDRFKNGLESLNETKELLLKTLPSP